MISKTVILARQSVETKYLRMTTTDSCQQQLFCCRQFSAIIAGRKEVPVDIGRHLDRRVPQAVLHHFARRTLGRAHREWPRGRRAADERYELTPVHSITSSASASTLSGISRPSDFAVLRLITRSNRVASTTG